MNKHDTVVSSSRLQVVLLSVPFQKHLLMYQLYHLSKVSGLQWYVDDSPHLWAVLGSALTGEMGENGQSSDRVAKPCTDQTVGC